MGSSLYGGVEVGGTKVVCVLGSGATVHERARFPTRDPAATLADVVGFFRARQTPRALGVASFGPLELRRDLPEWGRLRETPKPGWSGVDVCGPLAAAIGVPIGLETDVGAAALAEGRHGAAAGLGTFVYLTVGTGIGGAAVTDGRVVRGLGHAEMGHVPVPREPGDAYPGRCPFHGDCLEGMTSGPALADRFGGPLERLDAESRERAAALAACYLASGLRSLVYTLAPERIVVGGGVASIEGLHALVREQLVTRLGGYPGLPEHAAPGFVVPPGLGADAGPIGALLIAEATALGA